MAEPLVYLEEIGVEPISHGQAQDWFDSPFVGWFAKDGHEIERSPCDGNHAKGCLGIYQSFGDPEADGKTVGELLMNLGSQTNFSLKDLSAASFTTLLSPHSNLP